METMAISKFKATCLAVMERVRRTGEPVLITRRGRPVARVTPPEPASVKSTSAYGAMAADAEEFGDIVEPLPESDWEALR